MLNVAEINKVAEIIKAGLSNDEVASIVDNMDNSTRQKSAEHTFMECITNSGILYTISRISTNDIENFAEIEYYQAVEGILKTNGAQETLDFLFGELVNDRICVSESVRLAHRRAASSVLDHFVGAVQVAVQDRKSS